MGLEEEGWRWYRQGCRQVPPVDVADPLQFEHFDAEMMAALQSHIAAEDAVLLGRVTYQEWAPYWPTSTDEPYARESVSLTSGAT